MTDFLLEDLQGDAPEPITHKDLEDLLHLCWWVEEADRIVRYNVNGCHKERMIIERIAKQLDIKLGNRHDD